MHTFEQIVPDTFTAKVRGVAFQVEDIHEMSAAGLRKIVEYGLQRIFNDSAASAKNDEEAIALAAKRLEALRSGVLRQSAVREGNPIRARALELASGRIRTNAKFVAWLTANGLKLGSKEAVAEIRRQAVIACDKPDNAFMAQAAIDVAAAKGLDDIELDL
jgi:hypothetical protein